MAWMKMKGIQSEVTWNDFKKGKANSGPMDIDEWLGMTATQMKNTTIYWLYIDIGAFVNSTSSIQLDSYWLLCC